jgi:hypothetical protein
VHTRFCPECEEQAEDCIAVCFLAISWGISSRRLDLPYFLCVRCNLVGTDWKLIRKCFNDLYKDRLNKKVHCYRELYQKIVEFMQKEIIGWRKSRFGDKEAEFTRWSS